MLLQKLNKEVIAILYSVGKIIKNSYFIYLFFKINFNI